MTRKLQDQIGALAADAINLATQSGLSWDDAVAAFGVASKTLSVKAAVQGHGSKDEYASRAVERFKQGMGQDVTALVSRT